MGLRANLASTILGIFSCVGCSLNASTTQQVASLWLAVTHIKWLKKIQFEDLNFDQKYTAWNSYAQSKLAQMMFGYELQRRIQVTEKSVQVHVCHPGASRTNLLMDTASTFNKLTWSILSRVIAQSAEKGAWPEVMCATQDGLKLETLYGPTKRMDTVGPVGECALEGHALDRDMAAKLWTLSEQKTGLSWFNMS